MPDVVKKEINPENPLPRDLPMPPYDYQRSEGGSFQVIYDHKREAERQERREKTPFLQNLVFNV